MITITALNFYPVKSCRGIAMQRGCITSTGFMHDREWMIVKPDGRFVTQRAEPRLALITALLTDTELQLSAPGAGTVSIALAAGGAAAEVDCWGDRCAAFDAGDAVARWLGIYLGTEHRLVRFDPRHRRLSASEWTHGVEALNQFSDGYPWLLISQASLDDLNNRLPEPVPMDRFRPNIVVEGLNAYDEDRVYEFATEDVRMRAAKPCLRCAITTTDQATAIRASDQPLRALREYRFSRELRGVCFGQNLILVAGVGAQLQVGQSLGITWQAGAN